MLPKQKFRMCLVHRMTSPNEAQLDAVLISKQHFDGEGVLNEDVYVF